MKLMEKKLGKYAVLRGYLHEYDPETPNIKEYPAILVVGSDFIVMDRLKIRDHHAIIANILAQRVHALFTGVYPFSVHFIVRAHNHPRPGIL